MSAAQIAEKNIAARGGLEAWRAVNTLTLTGEMDAGGKKDMKLPFVFSMKRPHKTRLEIALRGPDGGADLRRRQGLEAQALPRAQ